MNNFKALAPPTFVCKSKLAIVSLHRANGQTGCRDHSPDSREHGAASLTCPNGMEAEVSGFLLSWHPPRPLLLFTAKVSHRCHSRSCKFRLLRDFLEQICQLNDFVMFAVCTRILK